MSRENRPASDLIGKLTQARILIDEALAQAENSRRKKQDSASSTGMVHAARGASDLDFDKPVRAFMKAYAKNLSGTKKFVLLVARLAKGDSKTDISMEDLQKQWRRMSSKSVLGMDFNSFYSTEAREKDWVDSKKKGLYNLRPSWKDIFR